MSAVPALRVRPAGSFMTGSLPTGCALCEAGTKLVLFVTGVCHYTCFYCPISEKKRMNRAAWANERELDMTAAMQPGDAEWDAEDARDLKALAAEVESIGAKGTGMTGGDPLYDPERTLRFIRFLKRRFGPKHHIHLYTQIPFDSKWLAAMQEAGLDELRFHPPDETWEDPDKHPQYTKLWLEARRMEQAGLWDVGFEIPCVPGSQEHMWGLVQWLDRHGFKFINANEMEFSETNYVALLAKGYRIKDTETSRAMDSEEVAREVMRRASEADIKTAIHFCSSPFKDRVQLRQRLTRQATRTAKPYDVVTDDGTLVRGVIVCPEPAALAAEVVAAFAIDAELFEVDAAGGRLLIAPWLLEQFAHECPFPAYASEFYPTATALEVERIPLNQLAEDVPPPVRPGVPERDPNAPPIVERDLADLHALGRPGQ